MYGAPTQWKSWTKAERIQWLRNQVGFLSNKQGADSMDGYWLKQWQKKLAKLVAA